MFAPLMPRSSLLWSGGLCPGSRLPTCGQEGRKVVYAGSQCGGFVTIPKLRCGFFLPSVSSFLLSSCVTNASCGTYIAPTCIKTGSSWDCVGGACVSHIIEVNQAILACSSCKPGWPCIASLRSIDLWGVESNRIGCCHCCHVFSMRLESSKPRGGLHYSYCAHEPSNRGRPLT